MDCIVLTQDRVQWETSVDTVVNICSIKAQNFQTSWVTVSFSAKINGGPLQ
jgi:hypothetical protein